MRFNTMKYLSHIQMTDTVQKIFISGLTEHERFLLEVFSNSEDMYEIFVMVEKDHYSVTNTFFNTQLLNCDVLDFYLRWKNNEDNKNNYRIDADILQDLYFQLEKLIISKELKTELKPSETKIKRLKI